MSRVALLVTCLVLSGTLTAVVALAAQSGTLTQTQLEIEKQRQRLSSADEEERRDALMKLGVMHLPDASRAALPALSDISPIVRATAAKAILSAGETEAVGALSALLNDKDEFVRREAAYALGLTRNRRATPLLSGLLLNDKEAGVRGAAAVALGEIADEAAVISLVATLAPELSGGDKRKQRREQNAFVLRAAAVSLGEIRSRAGTAALIKTLEDDRLPGDVRREAARSLGLIGDPSAATALKVASTADDPYLSETAHEALRRLSP